MHKLKLDLCIATDLREESGVSHGVLSGMFSAETGIVEVGSRLAS